MLGETKSEREECLCLDSHTDPLQAPKPEYVRKKIYWERVTAMLQTKNSSETGGSETPG